MLYIAVDFDGTIVKHEYPDIGEDIPMVIDTLKEIVNNGHKLILYTMRSDEYLEDAVNYLKEKGVELYSVNNNPTQYNWTRSKKIYANLYIDDAALGIPLIVESGVRPYVNWHVVKEMLNVRGIIK